MFFKSTEDKKHYHVVITPDLAKLAQQQQTVSDANSVVGVAKDHQHPILELDPESGDVVLGEVDGHTHTFNVGKKMEDLPLPKVDEGKETVKAFKAKFDKAAKNDSKSIEDGAKAYKYYNQEQWEKDIKDNLETDRDWETLL